MSMFAGILRNVQLSPVENKKGQTTQRKRVEFGHIIENDAYKSHSKMKTSYVWSRTEAVTVPEQTGFVHTHTRASNRPDPQNIHYAYILFDYLPIVQVRRH